MSNAEKLLMMRAAVVIDPSSLLAEYWDRFETAKALGIDPHTLDRWRREGKGPPVTRFGNKIYYRISSVAAWVASHEKQPA
jgi:hypothetical protein